MKNYEKSVETSFTNKILSKYSFINQQTFFTKKSAMQLCKNIEGQLPKSEKRMFQLMVKLVWGPRIEVPLRIPIPDSFSGIPEIKPPTQTTNLPLVEC